MKKTSLFIIAGFLLVLAGLGVGLGVSRQSQQGFLSLEGAGCEKTSEGGICELVSQDTRVVLRDCGDGETLCDTTWYQLGSVNRNQQYVLLYAEGIQMLTVYAAERESLTLSEVGRFFYTEVAEGCETQQDVYEEECFPYPVTEEQRRDVWQNNQAYREAEEEYQ
jgi:hypothetical protein